MTNRVVQRSPSGAAGGASEGVCDARTITTLRLFECKTDPPRNSSGIASRGHDIRPVFATAAVPRSRNPLVLAIRHPRIAGDVPEIREPSGETALMPQDLVDGARTPRDVAT